MCGIIGILGPKQAAKEVFLGLFTLQHRGQDAAGILSYNDGSEDSRAHGFHLWKELGLVEKVFSKKRLERLKGNIAIGHTRYATVGSSEDESYIQPFVLNYPFGIGMAHNGNIINHEEISEHLLKESRRHFLTHSDLEVIQNLFANKLAEVSTPKDTLSIDQISLAVEAVFKQAVGGYSVVSMIAGQGMVAFRDPKGIRPLVLGEKTLPDGKKAYCVASETTGFSILDYTVVRDIKAGELIYITLNGEIHSKIIEKNSEHSPCMFEWVYFSGVEGVLEKKAVYEARLDMGKGLAKLVKAAIDRGEIRPDIVVPVPETARIAAIALAEALGLPYREVLIKNRYINRSFILNTQEKRNKAVNLKLNPVRTEIKGKNVLLVDDSIVRGTTSSRIVEMVRKAEAKEVYFASTCSPIRNPCYYGIDFPSTKELLATDRTEEEIAKKLLADKVIYLDQERLRSAIGIKKLCMACLDGKYPTDISAGKRFRKKRLQQREEKIKEEALANE